VVAALACAVAASVCAQTQPAASRSRSFGPDSCGPADPAYIHTANETGGIPMFLQRSETAKAFHLLRESTRNNVATILWATATLDRPQSFEIPVDAFTRRLTFAFSTDTRGNRFSLSRPSGPQVANATADVQITELNCGRIVTVVSPEPGNWRAEISGAGRFWLEAQGQTDIYFIKADFVEVRGRPGHEGFFRIQGQPLSGKPATLEVSLSAGATRTTRFYLANESGKHIQDIRMRAVTSDRQFLELVGDLEPPGVPFRVAVAGEDSSGKPYQRFFSSLFHAETVEVSPRMAFDELPAGGTKHVVFAIRNLGPSRTFKITATDSGHFIQNPERRQLALPANGTRTIQLELAVPLSAPEAEDDVVVVATSTSEPASSNSSVVHFRVVAGAAH
jgi:hypothetical protein